MNVQFWKQGYHGDSVCRPSIWRTAILNKTQQLYSLTSEINMNVNQLYSPGVLTMCTAEQKSVCYMLQ